MPSPPSILSPIPMQPTTPSLGISPPEMDGDGLIRLGIAAMDRKSRSKPMTNILTRLLATGKFETVVFGDKVILDDDIEQWPKVDVLISFYSSHFPIDKAISYVRLCKPVLVNDLPFQKIFWDRRLVLDVLDYIGVPTPRRVEVNRSPSTKENEKVTRGEEEPLEENVPWDGAGLDDVIKEVKEFLKIDGEGGRKLQTIGKMEKDKDKESEHTKDKEREGREGKRHNPLHHLMHHHKKEKEKDHSHSHLSTSLKEDLPVSSASSFTSQPSRSETSISSIYNSNSVLTSGNISNIINNLSQEDGDNFQKLFRPRIPSKWYYDDETQTLFSDGKSITKPFVEKPVSGENHDVYIYFHKDNGGGGRKLFRKVANKSSEFDPNLSHPRTDGSYIYESLLDTKNSEDIKIYTLGSHNFHAEARKSPVVDGIVRRNDDGKEVRYVTKLTEEEQSIAKRISIAFRQEICGFDLLRIGSKGRPVVIDVNGWSFVKGNEEYYDRCAKLLFEFCAHHYPRIYRTPSLPRGHPRQRSTSPANRERGWNLKAVIVVIRHADRTPKSKMKFTFHAKDEATKPFQDLLQGRVGEILLRKKEELECIIEACDLALPLKGANQEQLEQLKLIISRKIDEKGSKAQLKPAFSDDGVFQKMQVIFKWGGEFTHAGTYQSRDLGENMRKDYMILNNSSFDDTRVYTSSERRVSATAEVFQAAFLKHSEDDGVDEEELKKDLIFRKDLLDDSNAAKDPMDRVKKQLKSLLRPGGYERPEFGWSLEQTPFQVVCDTIELMKYHRRVMHDNWKKLDVDKIQSRWCCSEAPIMFRERWEKLFIDFCDVELDKFDPSRVSELYDTLKFDTLHNLKFLETIMSEGDPPPGTTTTATEDGKPPERQVQEKLNQLYQNAKVLFDLIAPQEYGIEKSEKLEIGLLTSMPLLDQIIQDLKEAEGEESDKVIGSFYFTKESHIHTVVNLITLSDLHIVMPRIFELDYLSYLSFEVFHRWNGSTRETSVRLGLSPGAHSSLLHLNLDSKHTIQCQPRRLLTNYTNLSSAIEVLSQYYEQSYFMKKSTTPLEGLHYETGLDGIKQKPSMSSISKGRLMTEPEPIDSERQVLDSSKGGSQVKTDSLKTEGM